jgi:hypothetical protein
MAAAAAAALLAMLLALPGAGRAQGVRGHGRRAIECAAWTPTLCAIDAVDALGASAQLGRRDCHPHPCAFHVAREWRCPLAAAGYFTYRPGGEGGGCPGNAFAQQAHFLPPCGGRTPGSTPRCCRTDHVGRFAPGGGSAAAADAPPAFQPKDSTCRYAALSRGQLMRYLASGPQALLFIGDSGMRQLFLRLVAMMRGQARPLDFHLHTHASYRVCREADFLRLAANAPADGAAADGGRGSADAAFLRAITPAFFRGQVGPGRADAERALAECSHEPLAIDYLQAPLWAGQAAALAAYLGSGGSGAASGGAVPGGLPVVVASVGLWQPGAEPPEAYFAALKAAAANATRVFLVGTPRPAALAPEAAARLAARDAALRAWAAREGYPFSFVDFHALASAEGAPAPAAGSGHFGCWSSWRGAVFNAGGAPAAAQLSARLERVHADADGECFDGVNRALVQVLLNAMVGGMPGDGAGKE